MSEREQLTELSSVAVQTWSSSLAPFDAFSLDIHSMQRARYTFLGGNKLRE